MSLRELPARLAHPARHTHTTVRWRLTLLYGALFLVCGAGLLAITYGLVSHANIQGPPRVAFIRGRGPIPPPFLRANGHITALPPQVRQRVLKLPPTVRRAFGSSAGKVVVSFAVSNKRVSDLHLLEVDSGLALAIMAIMSGLLGSVVAGRVLRPLLTLTA